MTLHRWSTETRTRQHTTPWGDIEAVTSTRFVCSCGTATRWFVDVERARSERDQHALDGQIALDG